MSGDIRDLLSRMADELDHYRQILSDDRREVHALAAEARAALAAEPVGEGPSDEELLESAAKALGYKSIPSDETCLTAEAGELLAYARAVLARWGRPAAPVAVPVAVSDALIKAECALSDVAEGEPECDDGDPAQWAEQRCAETLAVIRPVMKLRKIRTSEWPPQPLPQAGEGQL